MRHCFHCVAFLCFLAFTSEARAQDVPRRARTWASGGLGYGAFGCYTARSCSNFELAEAPAALGAFVSVGTSPTERVTAAVELSGWRKAQGQITHTLIVMSAALFLRPLATIPLRIRTGLGVSSASIGGTWDDIILNEQKTGVAASLGLVYDIRVAPTLSLSPGFNYGAQAIGSQIPRYMWQGLLGMTWHELPRSTRPDL